MCPQRGPLAGSVSNQIVASSSGQLPFPRPSPPSPPLSRHVDSLADSLVHSTYISTCSLQYLHYIQYIPHSLAKNPVWSMSHAEANTHTSINHAYNHTANPGASQGMLNLSTRLSHEALYQLTIQDVLLGLIVSRIMSYAKIIGKRRIRQC